MWIAIYLTGAFLMFVGLVLLRLSTGGEYENGPMSDRLFGASRDAVVIVTASALWPLTLAIQVVMVFMFFRDLNNWPQ